MFHKVRFETKDGYTHVFLDDTEVRGCTKANFDYDVNCVPVVRLELMAMDITVDVDEAKVEEIAGDGIECLKLPSRTYRTLKRGGVNTIPELIRLYQNGRIMELRNFGMMAFANVESALEECELV